MTTTTPEVKQGRARAIGDARDGNWSGAGRRMRDLAPHILRQRLVIEGLAEEPITAEQIVEYLSTLSGLLGMVELLSPVTHRSDTYGWAGWIHWETSGAHFYAWEQPVFFSVDIYTCKAFSVDVAVEFTQSFFQARAIESRSF